MAMKIKQFAQWAAYTFGVVLLTIFLFSAASGTWSESDIKYVDPTTINTTSEQFYALGAQRRGSTAVWQYDVTPDDSGDSTFITIYTRNSTDLTWVADRVDTLVGTTTTKFTYNPTGHLVRLGVVTQDTTVFEAGVLVEPAF